MGKHADEHLRRFLAARDRGDALTMRVWWGELVVDFYDRMDAFVAAAHRGRLDDDEHDLAVALCLARFSTRLVDTFRGVSMGELVNATKTLANHICMDVQRSAMRQRQKGGQSLDSTWDDGNRSGWDTDEAQRRYDDEEAAADARDFLGWALPQLGEDRRRVLELTLAGVELTDIVQELGISRDNVYARRSRGLRDLKKLKEQYDA